MVKKIYKSFSKMKNLPILLVNKLNMKEILMKSRVISYLEVVQKWKYTSEQIIFLSYLWKINKQFLHILLPFFFCFISEYNIEKIFKTLWSWMVNHKKYPVVSWDSKHYATITLRNIFIIKKEKIVSTLEISFVIYVRYQFYIEFIHFVM